MECGRAALRARLLPALCIWGLWAAGAGAQVGWQTSVITSWAPNTMYYCPPAITFDGQDRAQVVWVPASTTAVGPQHVSADQAGSLPQWTSTTSTGSGTGLTMSPLGGRGQIYLRTSGNNLYLGCWSHSKVPAVAVYDGATWQPVSVLPSNTTLAPRITLGGMVIDSEGKICLVVNTGGLTDASLGMGTYGYYLLRKKEPDPVTVSWVAPGIVPGPGATLSVAPLGGQAVLDATGTLHMVEYYENGSGRLLYAKGPTSGPFSVEANLDRGWGVKLGRPTIALDGEGHPHIAYTQQWPHYGVRHLYWTGSRWQAEWVETGGKIRQDLGLMPQVLVDKSDRVHVVYSDLLNGLLKHAVRTASGWQIETVDAIGIPDLYGAPRPYGLLTAAMDGTSGIGVVYWNSTLSVLKYAYLAAVP